MIRHTPPHPFFSRIGCGAALLLMALLVLITWISGGILFSPGDLAAAQANGQLLDGYASHAEFEHECGKCHDAWRGVTAALCEECHVDVGEQRRSGNGLHARFDSPGRCTDCHLEHLGRDANISERAQRQFEHERYTYFSLDKHQTTYEHQPLTCELCHVDLVFSADHIDCVTCHAAHDASFMTQHQQVFGSACLPCHDGSGAMTDFDHATVFPLEGVHADIACEKCHQNQVFSGTVRDCLGCHAEPAIHAGKFGLDCARCHTAHAWSPAKLTKHIFPLEHGGEGKIDCAVCHEQTYVIYTCYNCHAHPPDEIRRKHIEEGMTDFESCIECHPTGLKEENKGKTDD